MPETPEDMLDRLRTMTMPFGCEGQSKESIAIRWILAERERFREVNAELVAVLSAISSAWASISESDPVPDEINVDTLWTDARTVLARAAKETP